MQTFEDLGINPLIKKAVSELGYVTPTDIQQSVIPYLLEESRDLIALAQTGTGKTAAFSLPVLSQIDTGSQHIQAIVLAPTRELCVQIGNDIKAYSKYLKKLKTVLVYGGASAEKQIAELKKSCHIVAGTPGRVLDLIKRKKLDLSHVKYLVLDEADEMLDMGFKDELDGILENMPESRQSLLFSATMPPAVANIARKYMTDAHEISVGEKNIGAENVNHHYYLTKAKDRFKVLKRILDAHPKIYGIVFCRTRRDTKEVADKLIENGYNAEALHGDLSQMQRDYVMNRFRIKHLQILVATDVAARGLDVDDLSHVIHYNIPEEVKIYIHRSGRTGRAGKKGTSVLLIHSRELFRLREIEKNIGKNIIRKTIPSGKEICEKQLFNLIDKVENIEVDEEQIAPFTNVIYKKLNWLSREELIDHFVSVEFNRFLSYYKDAPDLNVYEDAQPKKEKEKRKKGKQSSGFSRFFINIGSKKKVSPAKLIGIINDCTGMRDINVGKIDILDSFSFFEVDSRYEDDILSSFQGCKYKNIKLVVELSKEKKKSGNRSKTPAKKNRKKKKNKRR